MVALISLAGCAEVLNGGISGGPGSKYQTYLGDDRTLVIELDHAPGAKPDQRALNDIKSELGVNGKRVEIRSSASLEAKGQQYSYSLNELVELHREHQNLQDSESEVVMHALFVDGKFEQESVAGIAYDPDAFAIFMGRISEITCENGAVLCPNRVHQWEVSRAVTIHEAGHLLGLVNSPLPMQSPHEMTRDPDSETPQNEGEGHSANENSVMYWAVEGRGGLESLVLGQDVPWEFDSNDLADMRAVQEGST